MAFTLAHAWKCRWRHPIDNDADFLAGARKSEYPHASRCIVGSSVCTHVVLAPAHVRHPLVTQTIATFGKHRLRRHPTAVRDRSRWTLRRSKKFTKKCVKINIVLVEFYVPLSSTGQRLGCQTVGWDLIRQRKIVRMTSDSWRCHLLMCIRCRRHHRSCRRDRAPVK